MVFSPGIDAGLAGVLGLLVGSFLNVVVWRLPRMMYRDWLRESVDNLVPAEGIPGLWRLVFGQAATPPKDLEAAAGAAVPQLDALPPLTLSRPRSRCPHCGAAIHWYQNIPVFSYLALRGRCASCAGPISVRYPLVEAATAGLFAFCAWRYGISLQAAFWAAFSSILVCQFLIDLDTQLLPDSLNYVLLWLGLLGAALKLTTVPVSAAVWGAVFGYLSLWSVYHAYRLLTGKHGFGYGDFKLLAALGAWLGAGSLVGVILLSSIVGAVLGIALLAVGKIAHKDIPISFGPFLAAAGLLAMILGPETFRELLPFAFPFDRF